MGLGVPLLVGVLTLITILAIGLCLLAIALLVYKIQAEYWLKTLQQNELVEPAMDSQLVVLNSKQQYLHCDLKPVFGNHLTLFQYDAGNGSLRCANGYLVRTKSRLALSPTMPANSAMRIQLSAGNNRGFLLWYEFPQGASRDHTTSGEAHVSWLYDDMSFMSAAPPTRPFLFLTSDLTV